MFRKALLPLLSAATFAAAIPLHLGESWVWQVSDRDSTTSNLRSARILDSMPTKDGTLWRIVGRDSSNHQEDTGQILALDDGRQYWVRKSFYLPWELGPRPSTPDSVPQFDGHPVYAWGDVFCTGCRKFDLQDYDHGSKYSRIVNDLVVWDLSVWEQGGIFPVPVGIWSDTLGLEYARIHAERAYAGFFRTSLAGSDWRLVRHNNQALTPKPDVLVIPPAGTALIWQYKSFSDTSSRILRLRVDQLLGDSIGWTGVRGVLVSSRLCVDSADSGCGKESTSDFVVRLKASTGQTLTNSRFGWLSDGWWERCVSSSNRTLALFTGGGRYGFIDSPSSDGSDSLYEAIRNHQLDSGYVNNWRNKESPLWVRLLRINNQVVRAEPSVAIHRSPEKKLDGIRSLALAAPQTLVRWSTASGRTGTIAASEFIQRPAALRGKTLFLQARLPDGRVWQGTHVVP